MLAVQETVSDPSDVINSLVKMPVVHILGMDAMQDLNYEQ